MAKSKPLSFLNHHLRTGNSLIGAKVADLDEIPKRKGKRGKPFDTSRAPVQLGIFQEAFNKKLYDLLQNRALIAQLPSETLEDIHNKEKWERDFEHNAERFHTLADLWVSTYFDNDVRWDEYNTLVESLQLPQPEWEKLLQKESVKKALAMREERHFFHWELEFPEVFYDEQGNRKANAGFDAVIGNPPYAILGNYGEFEPYFSLNYQSAKYKADSYMLFVEKGLILTRSGGLFSQIFPNKFHLTTSGKGLRQFLTKFRIENIVDFGTSQVFEGAINYVMIPVIIHTENELGEYSFHYRQTTKGFGETLAEFNVSSQSLLLDGWQLTPAKSRSLLEKIEHCADNLGELTESIFAGVQTGNDEIMIVKRTVAKQMQLETSLLRKFLRGRNIDRYEVNWEDGYLIYPYDVNGNLIGEKIMRAMYPKTWDYLKSHESDLRKRIWFGKGPEELSGAWYGLMYVPDKDLFDRLKLLCPYLSQNTSYSIDDEGSLFGVGAGYGVFVKDSVLLSIYYVLGQLNSKLCSYRFKQVSPEFQAGHKNNEVYIRQLPIRRIKFTTAEKERKQLLEQAKKLYQEYPHSHNWDKVLTFVAERLPQKADGTPDMEHEQSDVVHELLAFLTEEMTRLNKEKQAKIKGFLNWLEKEILKGSVEDQKNKTRIKDFHESSFEDLLDILKKNKVVPDPCPSNIRDTIAGEFTAVMNVLTPLKARVKATDNLIDQIVYKLYGLTNDEIAIVEGQKV